MKLFLIIVFLAVFCARAQFKKITEVDRISTNVQISCFEGPETRAAFWMVNDAVYGLLHLPRVFVVCSQILCDSGYLLIPLVLRGMNASGFQCTNINYQNSTIILGQLTKLTVISAPFAYTGTNNTKRDILELDYSRLSIGSTEASIAWRFSSQTCQPSVFTIEGFTDRNSLGGTVNTPTLALNSTFTEITFPTSLIQHNITSGAIYIRLLAYDEFGARCASESEIQYYKLSNSAGDFISIHASPEGSACIPIPIDRASGRDYSSLEVVWPENSSNDSKLCYCPPYEGERNLFSKCISTTSCNSSFFIAVTNHAICFSQLSQELASIPVFFTLLDFCLYHRCTVRSILASFRIIVHLVSPSPVPLLTLCFWNDSTAVKSYMVNVSDVSGNETGLSGTFITSQCLQSNISNPLISISSLDAGDGECSEKKVMVSLYAFLLPTGVAVLATVVLVSIFVLCACKKFRSKNNSVPKHNGLEARRHATSFPVTYESAVATVPVYEEIHELCEGKGHDNKKGENDLKAEYKITECPAYDVTTAL